MDYGAMIGRAWEVTRRYTWLWILGLLVVGLGSGNIDLSLPGGFDVAGPGEVAPLPAQSVMGVVTLTGLLVSIGVGLWVVGAVARGALIAAVHQIEREDGASLLDAWNDGVASFGRVFLIGVPVSVPALLLTFLTYVTALPGIAGEGAIDGLGDITTLCLLPLCCLLAAVSLGLTLIQTFADRAAVIEGLGPGQAYRRGWQVLTDNRDRLLRLVAIWALLTFVVRLLILLPTTALILPVLFLGVVGTSVGPGPLAVVCLAGFLTMLAMLLFSLVSVFTSTLWTLAYRSCIGLPPGAWAESKGSASVSATPGDDRPPATAEPDAARSTGQE
jgi:hypothetical protein